MWEDAPIDTAVDLRDLWRRFKESGDERARERLVLAYSPLVKYVSGRMASGLPAHVEESDLISYGLIGLINAIERFDPEREIKFETYAITRIKAAIIDELRTLDWVPRSVRAPAREIERANSKLEHQLHRAPTDEEMARELGISVEEFQGSLLQISNSTVAALDELWSVSDASAEQVLLLDTLQDPDADDPAQLVDAAELRDRLADAIARLPEREKLVAALYYYENLTLREIGEVLGVTESRVSQLHTKAVLRLRGQIDEAGRASLKRQKTGPDRLVEISQLVRNAHARDVFLARFEQLSVDRTGSIAAPGGVPDRLTAERWRAAGEIFAVTHEDSTVYPAFQFAKGAPKPVVGEAVRRFRSRGASEWEVALWFTTSNPWLGAIPAEVLDDRPDAVIGAVVRAFDYPV